MHIEMNVVGNMLQAPPCSNFIDDMTSEADVTVGMPETISVQLKEQHDISERISALQQKLANELSGSSGAVSLHMRRHCAVIIDIRDELIGKFQHVLAAGAAGAVGADSSETRRKQHQQSSVFPRDVHRTDKLAPLKRKKSKKR